MTLLLLMMMFIYIPAPEPIIDNAARDVDAFQFVFSFVVANTFHAPRNLISLFSA
jgi:hypothetical protein